MGRQGRAPAAGEGGYRYTGLPLVCHTVWQDTGVVDRVNTSSELATHLSQHVKSRVRGWLTSGPSGRLLGVLGDGEWDAMATPGGSTTPRYYAYAAVVYLYYYY